MKLFESSILTAEPLAKVEQWIKEAIESEVSLPHAMNLSTVDDLAQPSSRMVLLKQISDQYPMSFPPINVILLGINNAGKNKIEIEIIPKKKKNLNK